MTATRSLLDRLLNRPIPEPPTFSLGVHMQATATQATSPKPPKAAKANTPPDTTTDVRPALPDAAGLEAPAPDPQLRNTNDRLAWSLKRFDRTAHLEQATERVREAEVAWTEARRQGDAARVRDTYSSLQMAREQLDPHKAHGDLWHREAAAYRALLEDRQARNAEPLAEAKRRLAVVEQVKRETIERHRRELAHIEQHEALLREAIQTLDVRHR
jgi:hypothetical protein